MNWYRNAAMQNTLTPLQMQALVNNLILQLKQGPRGSYVETRQKVQSAYQNALSQSGASLQMNPGAIDEIMGALGYKGGKQDAMQMGQQGWEEPGMAKLRQQRQQQPAPVAAPAQPARPATPAPAPQRKNPFAF